MLPKEILRQVRRIEIVTSRVVNESMAGRYGSVFKGRGIEFDEVREYQPGDEIRTIDWNVTARTGRPYIKRYVEERELAVMFLVDLSRSMEFGTVRLLKHRLATELCAVLAFSAIKNNDKVGLLLFTDRVERYIPPKKGSNHVLRVIRDVLSFEPKYAATDIPAALQYLGRVLRRKTVVFLISDFYCGDITPALAVANRRHDLIAVRLVDPREETLPNAGWIRLESAEDGQAVWIDSASGSVRETYASEAAARKARLDAMLKRSRTDSIEVRTDGSYVEPILKFFHMRSLRR